MKTFIQTPIDGSNEGGRELRYRVRSDGQLVADQVELRGGQWVAFGQMASYEEAGEQTSLVVLKESGAFEAVYTIDTLAAELSMTSAGDRLRRQRRTDGADHAQRDVDKRSGVFIEPGSTITSTQIIGNVPPGSIVNITGVQLDNI